MLFSAHGLVLSPSHHLPAAVGLHNLPFPLRVGSFGTFHFKVVWLKAQLVLSLNTGVKAPVLGGCRCVTETMAEVIGKGGSAPALVFPPLTSAQLEIPGSDGWGWEDSDNCNMI